MDLITIVIPIYNVEKYLERCIKSVLSQTYKNIEILLINDGSPDRCDLIMEKYKKTDDRIICHYKENGGLSDARNYAIKKAKGKYICFIDSDDYIDKSFIEKLYFSIKENNSEISWCNFRKVDDNGEIGSIIINEDDLWSFEMASACNKLFLKDLFIKNKIEFPKGIWYEDLATTPRLIFKSNKVSWVDEELYNYYFNVGSITKTYSNRALEMKKVLEIIYTFASDNKLLKKQKNYEIIEYIFLYSGICDTAFRICYAKDGNIKEFNKMVDWIEEKFPSIYKNNISRKRLDYKRKVITFLVRHRLFFVIRLMIRIVKRGK